MTCLSGGLHLQDPSGPAGKRALWAEVIPEDSLEEGGKRLGENGQRHGRPQKGEKWSAQRHTAGYIRRQLGSQKNGESGLVWGQTSGGQRIVGILPASPLSLPSLQ